MSSDNSYVIRASDATNRLIVNQSGDTTISGTLEVQRLSITNTTARPTEINHTMHNGTYLVAISQNYSNNDLLFALRCPPLNQLWCFGVATSNQYIISHENSTKFSIQPNCNTTINGNLDVGSTGDNQMKIHGTGATTSYAEFKASNGQNCVWDFQNPSNSNIWPSIKVKGIKLMGSTPTDNLIIMQKATRINGSLNIGLNQDGTPLAMGNVKTYFNQVGSSCFMMMEGRYRDQGFLHFETNYQYGEMLTVRNTYFIRCSDYAGNPYVQTFQPLTRSSDDRLKENEELIENACGTLPKLRPQLRI